jgi:hypothetical protein
MAKLEGAARKEAKEAAAAQLAAVLAQRTAEVERVAAVKKAAAERLAQIRPSLVVRIRFEGLVFHNIVLDVFNDGFDGIGLDGTVLVGQAQFHFKASKLSSKDTRPFSITDVGKLPTHSQIVIRLSVRDVDANAYNLTAGPFNYARETGILGRTKRLRIDPPTWVLAR